KCNPVYSFYSSLLLMLDTFFPKRSITLTDRDPPYVTPAVKTMLRRKNSLMRQGKIEEANAIAGRIGNAITKFNASTLVRCNHRFNSADMWAKVRQLLHTSRSKPSCQAVSANILDDHFSNISTDNL